MRVNDRVFTETLDLAGEIRIPKCEPSELRSAAERLMAMITKPGYSTQDYHSVTQLDKILTLDFWREYDGFQSANFEQWFLSSTPTSLDLISRARRWLAGHNYIILKPDVQDNAIEAGLKWQRAIRGKA